MRSRFTQLAVATSSARETTAAQVLASPLCFRRSVICRAPTQVWRADHGQPWCWLNPGTPPRGAWLRAAHWPRRRPRVCRLRDGGSSPRTAWVLRDCSCRPVCTIRVCQESSVQRPNTLVVPRNDYVIRGETGSGLDTSLTKYYNEIVTVSRISRTTRFRVVRERSCARRTPRSARNSSAPPGSRPASR